MAESSQPNIISNTEFGLGESIQADGSQQKSIEAGEISGEGGAQTAATPPSKLQKEQGAARSDTVDIETSTANDTNRNVANQYDNEHHRSAHRDVSPGTKVHPSENRNQEDKIVEAPNQKASTVSRHDALSPSHDQKPLGSNSGNEQTSGGSHQKTGTDLDDGTDFHKRSSATHNPIIKVRDKLFPAGAGPGADAAPPFEKDPNFHPTPSKTHNPIIAVRDHLFPAGKGDAADTHEFESDPTFHAKSSKSHNPLIAVRDKLFPAGSSNPNDEHATTHPRANDTTGHHNFPGFDSPAHPEPGSDRRRSSNVIVEPHTGLPMDLSRGTGKGGIDGNIHNPGYTGGGVVPPDLSAEVNERRKSTVVEPHTGLPMNLRKGSGAGGIDGNTHITGYQTEEPKA